MNKKSISRNKSFQPSGAGKGDGDRTSDADSYRANYDSIDWGHERELKNAYQTQFDARFRKPFDQHTRGS